MALICTPFGHSTSSRIIVAGYGDGREPGGVLRDGSRCARRPRLRRPEAGRGLPSAGRHQRLVLPLLFSVGRPTRANSSRSGSRRPPGSGSPSCAPFRIRAAASTRSSTSVWRCRTAPRPPSGYWSALDPKVWAVQSGWTTCGSGSAGVRAGAPADDRQAELFASWSLYLLVGYEQSTRPPDMVGLTWMVGTAARRPGLGPVLVDAAEMMSSPPL